MHDASPVTVILYSTATLMCSHIRGTLWDGISARTEGLSRRLVQSTALVQSIPLYGSAQVLALSTSLA